MKQRLIRFMAGRHGNDQFNNFLLIVSLVIMFIASFTGGTVSYVMLGAAMLLLFFSYFRMFSRNVNRRREENGKYMRLKYKLQAALRLRKERWVQRKDYKFFTCPSCRTTLRVPRGHGKIKIVCRKCGSSFTGKS